MKKINKIFFCIAIAVAFISIGEVALSVKINTFENSKDTRLISSTDYIVNSPPGIPVINGPTKGTLGVTYNYTVVSTDPEGNMVYYWIKWEPGCPSVTWDGPYPSGQVVTFSHWFSTRGSYSISCVAKDIFEAESDPGYLKVRMPRDRAINGPFLIFMQHFFENFPYLSKIL